MDNEQARARFVDAFVKLTNANNQKAADLMECICTSINKLGRRAGEASNGVNQDLYNQLSTLQTKLTQLATYCAVAVRDNTAYMLPHVVWRVKGERMLGTLRNLDRLRTAINLCNDGDDSDDCVEWLQSQVDIRVCDDCGEWEYEAKFRSTWDDDRVCRSCQEDHYRWSDYHDTFIHEDYAVTALDAYGGHVTVHQESDDFHWSDEADCYVHVDYDPPEPPIIGRYHSSKDRQSPIVDEWSTLKHRWFGVELEVEADPNNVTADNKAAFLHDLINDGERGKRVFFESDGSINYGFEIISQPMSLPAHRELWSWLRNKDAIRYLKSHQTRTCGLHVHVNRDNLSQLQIAKIVTFVNDPGNEELIRSVARRYGEGYCKIKEKKMEDAHQSTDRYEAVNITGRRTIEFRIFKGSLKYESVIAAIEFCHALVEFAGDATTNDVTKLTADHFIDFINNRASDETATLRPYMNNRLELA